MRQLKIAQVTPFYFPHLGGVETVVKEYSERLVKRGHKVDVYTTDGSWRSPWVEDINGVKLHRSIRVPLPILKPLSPAFLFPFKLLRADVDLIHLHANKYFSTDAGALVAKLRGKPLIFSPHAGTFGKSLFGRIYNQTIGKLALSADVVICVSEHEKRLIGGSGIKVKRFEVVSNGVALQKYEGHITKDQKMVLYVGRLLPHKGLDTLIKAAPSVLERIPRARFVIAGPISGGWKLDVGGLTKDSLVLLGEVSEEEKIALMQRARIFCLPSRSEAFGITVIEAMAAGCPVIVSNIPALTEIVTNGQTGLVFPVNDEKALADRIVKILSDQDLHQSLSENAKALVRERYDWEKIIDRLEDIYKSL